MGCAAPLGQGFRHEVLRSAPGLSSKGTALHGQRFVELFAGTCRLARAAAKRGVSAYSYELTRSTSENVLDKSCTAFLLAAIGRGAVAGLHAGIVCASWSRARRAPISSPFPSALRGDSISEIWGLPGLSDRDQARVDLGNRMVRWLVRIIKSCIKHRVPITVENPLTSRIWLAPPLQKLLGKCSSIVSSSSRLASPCPAGKCMWALVQL